ncbi:CHAT domain-containing protein [Aequorivita sp. H23M31]|uniref:CHAT domain-containing protein n=1 Tax=Aequorivita ciconiae TaxID=2494375 RepID=A0A410G5V3_9FLAO|nr:CHAT domain-containing tetratricopeptide repeat protein [Aequorivita sp. H23M31]QAA82652.1 CHAT domain-containing protein [Aequorivita sp. H23M31]
MKIRVRIVRAVFSICLLSIIPAHSQEKAYSVNDIRNLISQDSLKKAKTIVSDNIELYKAEKQYDSLIEYIRFQGHFKLNDNNTEKAIAKAKELTGYITANKDPHLIALAYKQMSYIYDNAGQHIKAYDLMLEAVEPTSHITDPKNTDAASVQYSLGYYKFKIGNYPLAKKHYNKSLALLKKSGNDDYVFYNQVYVSLGGLLWQEAKLDSAQVYFQEALEILKKTDTTDLKNKLFRPSLIKLNMSVLLNALGRNKEAITISYEAIEDLQEFIEKTTDEFYIRQARNFIYSILDNLASYHNTLGEYKRSEEIMEYSYAQKQKMYPENDMPIIISHIILAQAKTINQDYEDATKHADLALELYKQRPDEDSYWKAALYSVKGTIYERTGNMELARKFYEKGDQVYRNSSNGNFSQNFLDHLIMLSQFYVKIGEDQKAIATAFEAYNHIRASSFRNTLQEFYHIQNIAKVYFELKDYKNALKYSNEAINFNLMADGRKMSGLDSILVQYRKPPAILIKINSEYNLSENKSPKILKQYLSEIDQAISILDQRKKVVTTHEDVTLLINDNEELFNLAKKLRLELYETTKDVHYIDQVISLHESAIYSRIRSRLSLRENIAFKNVPKRVLEKETHLKNSIATTIGDTERGIDAYIDASEEWENFLGSLQKDYPEYYKMRYGTVEKPIQNLQQKIPENTTIVRYFFIEDQLYAYIVSHTEKNIVLLSSSNVKNYVQQLNVEDFSVEKKSPLLFNLYNELWQPIEPYIKTRKIIIVPDRELFNLSFEMLTPKPIKNFKEFETNSLLAKYDISYNFSLLLYKDRKKIIDYSENYVGFAPGFNKKMKQNYRLGLQDSVNLDKMYLTLLPQPFSENLIKQYAKTFDGEYFMNENASKTLFVNKAKDHKIIHIGTHAESNNITPELSRLLFAKKSKDRETYDDNSLYVYEVYNIDLSSNLAILTACETGKPTYQAGEGAISLAHAFNYAGSESILTSLWNIDEVSSSKIVGYFYDYLSDGLPKDEALKKAKFKYLSTVEGRGAAPQYWAGLVLVGDTSPLHLQNNTNPIWWWILGLGLISLIFVYFYQKRRI